ncbi:MAG: right-handed parallel beta-helix repeat-containing protein [Candidatus Thermoplasmatota archaeon]|nr:right-handed parallel beta-helix repeat-containing protein [Candidatus Thermoplasmatota archaeon]
MSREGWDIVDCGRDTFGAHVTVKRTCNPRPSVIDRGALHPKEAHVRRPPAKEERGTIPAALMAVVILVFSAVLIGLLVRTGEVSAYTPRSPFVIEGDSGLSTSDAVTGGSGTELDPYVISGWDIHADVSVGARILNTTAHLLIQEVWIHGEWTYTCVELLNVSNATFLDSVIQWGTEGVRLCDCADISFQNSTIHSCVGYGLSCCNVTRLSFVDSPVRYNDYGALFESDVDGLSMAEGGITENTYVNALFEGNLRNASFVNCTFNGCWHGDGVRILGDADNISFDGCDVISNIVCGLAIEGCSHDLVIANSTVNANSGLYGVSVRGDRVDITHNMFVDNHGIGVFLGEADEVGGCRVDNNTFRWNWEAGLEVFGQTNVVIDWNFADSNYEDGYRIAASDNCRVNSNSAAGNHWVGMLVNSSVTNSSFRDNSFVSNGMFFDFDYCSNISVEACTVNGLPLAYLEREDGATVTEAGQVIAFGCDALTVRGMNMSFSTVSVELWGCTNCTLQNVSGSHNWYGIYLANHSDNNSIVDCDLTAWNYHGVYLGSGSSNNTLSGCTVVSCSYDGVTLEGGANDNRIVDCIVRDNQLNGVYSCGCVNLSVVGSTISGNAGDGVSLLNGSWHLVEDTTLAENGYSGILLSNTWFSSLLNNTIESSGAYGFSLWCGSCDNEIASNIVFNCNQGIYIRGDDGTCSRNRITSNTLTLNSFCGLLLYYANENEFAYNSVTGSQWGVYISGFNVQYNYLYLNSFVGNDVNAYNNWVGNGNYWNTSTEVTYFYGSSYHTSYLGNYWDDYHGSDADGNGVGDSHYSFTNDKDMYPLMSGPPVYVPEYTGVLALVVSLIIVVFFVASKRWIGDRAQQT